MNREPKHCVVLLLNPSNTAAFKDLLISELEQFTGVEVIRIENPASRDNQRRWVANTAIEISNRTSERDILHIVAMGDAVNLLSDIAFANKASHRSTHSYILIDAIPEKSFPDWPDAPVTQIVTNQLSTLGQSAKLRGWDVVTVDNADLEQTVAKTLQKFFL